MLKNEAWQNSTFKQSNTMKPFLLPALLANLLLSESAFAQIPQLLNYQGRITDGGTNFDGAGLFKFALVNTTGTTNYWSNDGTLTGQPATGVTLTVTKGLYSVLLGDTSVAGINITVPTLIFTNTDIRLRVWFSDGTGYQQLSPDQRIAAVGYAMVAGNVDPTADVRGQRLLIGAGHNLSGLGATIAGGYLNDATNNYATVAGGLGNIAAGAGATCTGGVTNTASGLEATISGGTLNLASGSAAIIAGGYFNGATSNFCTVSGGLGNYVSGAGGTIAGGVTNTVTGLEATIAGGEFNWSTGTVATTGGGYGNLASGYASSIAGGYYNSATNTYATVSGGYGNLASGYAATIPGGFLNLASGPFSFAAGTGAIATNDGSFVWADDSSTNAVRSTTNNQFTARCAGGVRFFTSSNATVGVQLAAGAGSWSSISDRNMKANFKPVNVRAVLTRLVATPVTEWNLISQDPTIRHIGPMAQDFKAAFEVGEDDRHISTSDADGVAFAAIQGLYEELKERDQKIAALEKRLTYLESKIQPTETAGNP